MSLCPESDAGFMRLAADAPNDDEEDLTPSQQRRDARIDRVVLSSSFTPINRPKATSILPLPSSDIDATRSTSYEDVPDGCRKRNPHVADYLGLGQDSEASQFSLLGVPDTSKASKRRRQTSGDAAPRKTAKSNAKSTANVKSTQRRISDGMQTTKIKTRPTKTTSKPSKPAHGPPDVLAQSGSSNPVVLSEVSLNRLNSFRFQPIEVPADGSQDVQQQDGDQPTHNQIMLSDDAKLPEDHGSQFLTTPTNANVLGDSKAADVASDLTLSTEEMPTSVLHAKSSSKQSDSIQFSSDNYRASNAQDQPTTGSTDYGFDDCKSVPNGSDDESYGDWTAEELDELQATDLGLLSKAATIDQMAPVTGLQATSASGNLEIPHTKTADNSTDNFDLTDDWLSDTDLLQLEDFQLDLEEQHGHTTTDCVQASAQGENVHEGDELTHDSTNFDDWTSLDDEDFFALDDLEDNVPNSTTADPINQPIQAKPVSRQSDRANQSPHSNEQDIASAVASSDRSSHVATAGRQPVVRPPFPAQIRDRSPIIGLSANMQLRTCFRIGEALNVGCNANRNGKTVIIELYAQVSSSWREEDGIKQHFVFADLFHNHPPYLEGSYDLWKGVELWDYDSGRFLNSSSKLCRCIGKLKKDDKKWKLTILNIWEASWDDIEWVQAIICA